MSLLCKFDTLSIAKKLESSGLKKNESEAIVESLSAVLEELLTDNFFTRDDGKFIKVEIESIIDKLKTDNDIKLDKLEAKLDKLAIKIEMVKTDLENKIEMVKTDLENKIEMVKTDLENKIENKGNSLKHDLLRWMIGLMLAQTGLTVTILKFLH